MCYVEGPNTYKLNLFAIHVILSLIEPKYDILRKSIIMELEQEMFVFCHLLTVIVINLIRKSIPKNYME